MTRASASGPAISCGVSLAKQPKRTASNAAEYLRELNALRKKNEPPSFGTLADALFSQVTEWIPTGVLALDKFMGGGWPVGRLIEVCGWESVGKSTLLDQSAAQHQRSGGVTALIDSEQARDAKYTTRLGVDTRKYILAEAEDLESGFEQLDKLVRVQREKQYELDKKKATRGQRPPPVLLLWDSLGGHAARAEKKSDPDDALVAEHARVVSRNFRRIVNYLPAARITVVFANHFYRQIGGPTSGQLQAFAGKGVKYYTSVRLWLARTGILKSDDVPIGFTVEAKLKKTRVGRPREPIELGFVNGGGFDNAYTLYEWARGHGVGPNYPDHRYVIERGSYRYLSIPGQPEEVPIKGGFLGLGQLLAEKPDVYRVLASAFMASES